MGGSKTNTVQSADPWSGLQPYMTSGFQQAADIYQNNPSSYYPGQSYLPMNPIQASAVDAQLENVGELGGISGASQQGLGALLGASDLQNNPYAQQYAGAVGQNLYGNIGSTIGQLGRGFMAQGEDLGLQNQSLIDQQMRGLGAAGNQYSNQIADLVGQQNVAYNQAANQMGFDLGNLSGQQQRAYDAQAGRTLDDLAYMRAQQGRDYDVSANRLFENLTENALPSIANEAVSAGQTGSSRQGVAEGIAMGKFGQALGDLSRSQDETYAAGLRSAGMGLGDLSRSQAENLGAFGQQGALSLGNLGANQAQQLGSSVASGVTGLGDLARTGQETIGQNAFTSLMGQNQLAREQAGQLGDVGQNLTSQAGQDIAQFMADQYGQGLDATKSGILAAPAVAATSQMPYQSLYQVGDILQQEQMKPLSEAMDRYYYNQQAPWQDLSNYTASINSMPVSGGQSSMATSGGGNAAGGAAGGAMAGYSVGGPWGALIGAVLGGIASR